MEIERYLYISRKGHFKSLSWIEMAAFSSSLAAPSSPRILEADKSSLTLIWDLDTSSLSSSGWSDPKVGYELQISECLDKSQAKSEESWTLWKTLKSDIKNNFVRKNNLLPTSAYRFRVRAKVEGNQVSGTSAKIGRSTVQSDFSAVCSDPPFFETLGEHVLLMEPPVTVAMDAESVTLQWVAPPPLTQASGAITPVVGYQFRYRSERESTWTVLDKVLSSLQVRKKNLLPDVQYFFSVIPVLGDSAAAADSASPSPQFAWSLSSQPAVLASLSAGMAALMPPQLLSKKGLVDTRQALRGKTVLIYFSAHWCGPCRIYTPQLASIYRQAKEQGLDAKFEIVFCSSDNDEDEFSGYYGEHPAWLAIPYSSEQREKLGATFQVRGIPHLIALHPNGTVIEADARSKMSLPKLTEWIATGSSSASVAKKAEPSHAHAHDHSHGHAHAHEHGPGCRH
jgi:thiol-disulfide isomerase/thioredoxin